MKYWERAGMQLLKLVIIISLLLTVMLFTKTSNIAPGEVIKTLFLSAKGLLMIGAIALFSFIYPFYAYGTIEVEASIEEDKDAIINALASLGYKVESYGDSGATFRSASSVKQLINMFQNRITMTQNNDKIVIEGLKKYIAPIELRIRIHLK